MKTNRFTQSANLVLLERAASKLGELCNEVVFLGGCTTALFITDPIAPDVRQTIDVDCIIDVISLRQYHEVAKKLHDKGFKQPMGNDVICRWHNGGLILDVMPTDEKILGFGNIWYKDAIHNAKSITLSNKVSIKCITSPYFLATKLEAFKTRGRSDFLGSHDFEDILSVIDGRPEIVSEVQQSSSKLKDYLRKTFSNFIKGQFFHDALPGHLNYGSVVEDRVLIVNERINAMLKLI